MEIDIAKLMYYLSSGLDPSSDRSSTGRSVGFRTVTVHVTWPLQIATEEHAQDPS